MRDRKQTKTARRGERGTAMITTLVALVALIGSGALAVDAGLIWVARTQLQNVVDSAALAGAAELIDSSTLPVVVTRGASLIAVDTYYTSNLSIHDPISIDPTDIEFGDWNQLTEVFTTPVDPVDPAVNTAVRVTARMDGTLNDPVRAFLARLFGRTSFDVTASATAYMGYAGVIATGTVLPITIDCCKIKGDAGPGANPRCPYDYCDYIEANKPNACDLSPEAAQDEGDTEVTCLEFFATEQQNACWTSFDGYSSSVNVPDIIDLVEGGDYEVGYEDIYVDNGTKTPVVRELYEKMHGEGGYMADGPAGEDYYEPKDGVMDSWVVGFPVVECQTDDHCAGGNPAMIIGFVCFEIREIIVTPDKLIKGRFLCPERDPELWDKCGIGPGGSGGQNFGLRAEIPVLVQ